MSLTRLLIILGLIFPLTFMSSNAATPEGAFPGSVSAEEITRGDLGKTVTIYGEIKSLSPSRGDRVPHSLFVTDREADNLAVIFWPDIQASILPQNQLPPAGTMMTAKGELSDYRGTLQIRIRSSEQIAFLNLDTPNADISSSSTPPEANADGYYSPADIAALKDFQGRDLSMKGPVLSFREAWNERAPNIIKIGEDGQEIEVVFWAELSTIDSKLQETGNIVYATGTFQDYQGRLQLAVRDLENLSTAPLPSDRVAGSLVEIKPSTSTAEGWPGKSLNTLARTLKIDEAETYSPEKLAPGNDQETVKVNGTLSAPLKRSSGETFYLLNDGSGFITVLGLDDSKAKKGEVSIEGRLVYNENLDILELSVN